MLQNPTVPVKLDLEPKSKKSKPSLSQSGIQEVEDCRKSTLGEVAGVGDQTSIRQEDADDSTSNTSQLVLPKSEQRNLVKDFFKMLTELTEEKEKLERRVQEQEVQVKKDTEVCNADEKETKRLKQLLAQHEIRCRKNQEKREKSANNLLKDRKEYDKHMKDYENICRKFQEITKSV